MKMRSRNSVTPELQRRLVLIRQRETWETFILLMRIFLCSGTLCGKSPNITRPPGRLKSARNVKLVLLPKQNVRQKHESQDTMAFLTSSYQKDGQYSAHLR